MYWCIYKSGCAIFKELFLSCLDLTMPLANFSVRQHWDFPAPAGPIINTLCQIARCFSVCSTFRQNMLSGSFSSCSQAWTTYDSRFSSRQQGGSTPWERPSSRPKNISTNKIIHSIRQQHYANLSLYSL